MKKLSTTQQHIVDLLKQDSSLFVIESVYWDWNKVIKNDREYKCTYFKRPTFDILVKLGYLVKSSEYTKSYKKWILTPNIILNQP